MIKTPGGYVSIDIRGLAPFILQIVVSLCEAMVGKKTCAWQQRRPSRWQVTKLLLAHWISRYCARNLKPNGPAVWWGAVCVAVAWFLPVLVNGRKVRGHDKTVLMVPSPGNGCEFWVMMKQSIWRAKNKAPARWPAALLTLSWQQE